MKIEIDVPDGISGDYKVETFVVSKEESLMTKMRAMCHGGRGYVPAGEYKRLYRKNTLVMSNTPNEIDDFMEFFWKAEGSVLINGLGLGVLVKALLDKPEITDITVIELSQDVINLVYPTYQNNERLTVICADAFTWKLPYGRKWNFIWHDIWDYITSDNLLEMKKLHLKYRGKASFQDSWCRKECLKLKKQDI